MARVNVDDNRIVVIWVWLTRCDNRNYKKADKHYWSDIVYTCQLSV